MHSPTREQIEDLGTDTHAQTNALTRAHTHDADINS